MKSISEATGHDGHLTWHKLNKILQRPVAFHPIFARIAGGAVPGLFLSQAFYWSNRTSDPDGWFYKTQEEWQMETELTRSEQETARKKLKDRKLLEENRRGLPAKLYYRLKRQNVLDALEEELNKSTEFAGDFEGGDPDCGIPANKDVSQTSPPKNSEPDCGNPADLTGQNQQSVQRTESTTETTTESTSNPSTQNSQQQQYVPTPKNAAATASLSEENFSIDDILDAALALETGASKESIKAQIVKSPMDAARIVREFSDRHQNDEAYCERKKTTRAACLVGMLKHPERWRDEPPLARKRRIAQAKRDAESEEQREKATRERLAREAEQETSAARKKLAGQTYNAWLRTSAEARQSMEERIARKQPALAEKVRAAGGMEKMPGGSPSWCDYLEAVHYELPNALEEFPMMNSAVGENDDGDDGEELDDEPGVLPAPDATEILARQIARFVADVRADVISAGNLPREEWMDFNDDQWAHICGEVEKQTAEE